MSKQKLTVVMSYSDNVKPTDDISDTQEYADDFAKQFLNYVNHLSKDICRDWDTCDVTMEVDCAIFHAHAEGNQHEQDKEYVRGSVAHPWQDCFKTTPPHDGNVLLAVSDHKEEESWSLLAAYWRDGRYFAGRDSDVSATKATLKTYKYAYWRYIGVPDVK